MFELLIVESTLSCCVYEMYCGNKVALLWLDNEQIRTLLKDSLYVHYY